MPGKGGLQLTGKLGEVIRESAQIGLSWVKSHAYELGITPSEDEQFSTDRDIARPRLLPLPVNTRARTIILTGRIKPSSDERTT